MGDVDQSPILNARRRRLNFIKTQAKRSTSDDLKTALRDPAAVRAPHPGVWGLRLALIRPLGYDVKDRKLTVNETGASTVRLIFRRYAELGSVALLKAELDRLGIVSKRREGGGGRLAGGQHFSRGASI